MGIYGKDFFNNINTELDKIHEQEKLVEQMKADNKKNLKPVFAYVQHSGLESDHLYIEYNEELLFREMTDIIKSLVRNIILSKTRQIFGIMPNKSYTP